MRILQFLFWVGLFLCVETTHAQVAYTKTGLNLRVLPSRNSEVVSTIPAVSMVSIEGCQGGWCNVYYLRNNGYVKEAYLIREKPNSSANHRVRSISPNRYYTNSVGERVQSPTYYNNTPSGATAVCNDGTYSFSRSRRGTCSHHGGVRRWL
jgi:uncharacterized protein YraI